LKAAGHKPGGLFLWIIPVAPFIVFHLLLLGFASTGILWLILVRMVPLPWNKTIRACSLMLIAGAATMIGLLFTFGMYQYLLIPLFLPVKWLLFGTGLIVLAGGCLILLALPAGSAGSARSAGPLLDDSGSRSDEIPIQRSG
jgi:hypothetical protein